MISKQEDDVSPQDIPSPPEDGESGVSPGSEDAAKGRMPLDVRLAQVCGKFIVLLDIAALATTCMCFYLLLICISDLDSDPLLRHGFFDYIFRVLEAVFLPILAAAFLAVPLLLYGLMSFTLRNDEEIRRTCATAIKRSCGALLLLLFVLLVVVSSFMHY